MRHHYYGHTIRSFNVVEGSRISLEKCSRCILQPQPIELREKERETERERVKEDKKKEIKRVEKKRK